MARESPIAIVTRLAQGSFGAFRGEAAVASGVTRRQLETLQRHGVIVRVFHDTYCLTAVASSHEQKLKSALLWAGDRAVTDRRSAAMLYAFEGVRVTKPAIVVPTTVRRRSGDVDIRYCDDRR